MKLHLLTAITRPENLPAIAASIAAARMIARSDTAIVWHWRFDDARLHVGGQVLKNQMLAGITDGWVAILDDDNSMHPSYLRAVTEALADNPDAAMLVIAQQHASGFVRRVHRKMLKQTHVDAGQVVVRRDTIGDQFISDHYCGDGEWIEGLASRIPDEQIVYIHEPVCFYNHLRKD